MKYPAVILAGGRATRMGGCDKCLLPLNSVPLLAHLLTTLRPQVRDVLLNTNSARAIFTDFGLTTLPDTLPGFLGPLSGLLTGMLWSREHHPSAPYILSVAGDMPFLPDDFAARLTAGLVERRADIAIARDLDSCHPVLGLWPVDLAERLKLDLQEGVRSVRKWLHGFSIAHVNFPRSAFFNINTAADLRAASDFTDREAKTRPKSRVSAGIEHHTKI